MTRWYVASFGVLLLIGVALWGGCAMAPASTTDLAFPLPLFHSQIAREVENLQSGMGQCAQGQEPVLRASFDAAGYRWNFLYAPETDRGLFLQYTKEEETPFHMWVFTGTEDAIHIVAHFDNPKAKFPDGPCSVLYPPKA
jgi:hypothetical protein